MKSGSAYEIIKFCDESLSTTEDQTNKMLDNFDPLNKEHYKIFQKIATLKNLLEDLKKQALQEF